ncbi:MAG: hypothetical protein OIF58_16035, partial [Cohaesibacter sp.]|nr:hypothetical protein [Cohaesibacter sp.]
HWIQHTSIHDENRDFGKSGKPPVKTARGLSAFRYVSNLIYNSKSKQNKTLTKIKHLRSLQNDEKSSRKICQLQI